MHRKCSYQNITCEVTGRLSCNLSSVNSQALQICPIFNYMELGNIRLGRNGAVGNNGEGSFLLLCQFIDYKWLEKTSPSTKIIPE